MILVEKDKKEIYNCIKTNHLYLEEMIRTQVINLQKTISTQQQDVETLRHQLTASLEDREQILQALNRVTIKLDEMENRIKRVELFESQVKEQAKAIREKKDETLRILQQRYAR